MRAILVCVDYADLLAVTVPYNRHHFEEVLVVTAQRDDATRELCRALDVRCLVTNSFYSDGAVFNKWRALEEGLDHYGRRGWLCVMDADVLWPRGAGPLLRPLLRPGRLYTPLRRMAPWPLVELNGRPTGCLPPEETWPSYPLHRNVAEWAGYTQVFHADDPHLGPAPWHETNWRHAGGADSMFQLKWPRGHKVRPPFEVLHLGPAGTNWCGRASPYADGTVPAGAAGRVDQLRGFVRGRCRGAPDPYRGEKT